MAAPGSRCHVCGASELIELPAYDHLARVTSDCKPWPSGGRMRVCRTCGVVQKAVDADWQAEIGRIYADYTPYFQSGGVEQAVFDPVNGEAARRSDRLLGQLTKHVSLPETGRMLDVGCGNGATLRAFGQLQPAWTMVGAEQNARYKDLIEQIPHVEQLYTGDVQHVPGEFRLVTLVHALEHIVDPGALLDQLRSKLDAGGLLIVQVPSYRWNPFDLLVADHASHFELSTATNLVERSGLTVLSAAEWVPKELTIVARRRGHGAELPGAAPQDPPGADPATPATLALSWLRSLVADARAAAARRPFGIFGTSIAATWLQSELPGQVDFFVDEDPRMAGKEFVGRPVYHPKDVPPGGTVFIALAPHIAQMVGRRLASGQVAYVQPQPFPDRQR